MAKYQTRIKTIEAVQFHIDQPHPEGVWQLPCGDYKYKKCMGYLKDKDWCLVDTGIICNPVDFERNYKELKE